MRFILPVIAHLALTSQALAYMAEYPAPHLHPGVASFGVVPPNPRLVVFVPARGSGEVRVFADGKEVPVTFEPIADVSHHNYAPFSAQIETGAAKTLQVRFIRDGQTIEQSYAISTSWRRQPKPNVIGISRVRPDCLGYGSDFLRVTLDSDAIAYRLRWQGDEPGQSVVPTNYWLRRFDASGRVHWEGHASVPSVEWPRLPHDIDLGLALDEETVPGRLLDTGAEVGIIALYPDGSEELVDTVALSKQPAKSTYLTSRPVSYWVRAPSEPPVTPRGPGIMALVAFLGIAPAGGALGAWLRYRRSL